jgi:hypothetical protein
MDIPDASAYDLNDPILFFPSTVTNTIILHNRSYLNFEGEP